MELKEIRSERVPDGTQMNHVDCDTEKAVTDVYVEDKRTRQSLLSNCQPNGTEKATAEPENEENVTDKTPNCVARGIDKVSQSVQAFYSRHKRTISLTVRCVFVALWVAYLVYAAYLNGQRALVVIIITAIVFFFVSYEYLQRRYGDVIYDVICRLLAGVKCGKRMWKYTHWTFYALLLAGLTVFLVLDTGRNPQNFRSAGGLTLLLLLTFVTSKYPAKIHWRPVLWGLAFQFLMGLMVLRWSAGFALFQFLGAQVQTFAGFVDAGSKMVFGDPGYKMHPVAFQILPIIIFYSAVINVLYYYGAIQWMVRKMAWLMQVTMKITPIEALHTAASIFLGQVETGVMFRPFWQRLTQSELCACMTGGFTTIAGTVIAAFIAFGASPEHLISASIMSAPAAMAIAKLGFPETETSHTKTEEDVQMAPPPERSLVEAVCNGMLAAIKLTAVVAAGLITFLSLVEAMDTILGYLGDLVDVPDVNFQLICSYLFSPLAVVIGADWQDALIVGKLLGVKIFFSEFLAFSQLKPYIDNGLITERTRVVCTYALAGFGSIPSIGIYMSSLITIEPRKKENIVDVAVRAMVYGNIACMMTASMAGLLYTGGTAVAANTDLLNATISANTTAQP